MATETSSLERPLLPDVRLRNHNNRSHMTNKPGPSLSLINDDGKKSPSPLKAMKPPKDTQVGSDEDNQG